MSGDPEPHDGPSESTVREIVRDEIRAMAAEPTTRRRLLGALGVAGASGLAGFSVGSQSFGGGRLRVTDDGSSVREDVQTLNFGRNLRASVDGDLVTVDGRPTGSGSSPGAYLAERGDLQATLDDAFADDVGWVELLSDVTYAPTAPMTVPPGVTLDCNGARIAPRADVNVFELHTQSRVQNPVVDTTGVSGYSSSVFHVYPAQFDEPFGSTRPVPVWTVDGGWSEMTPGEGTCIELHGVRRRPDGTYDVGEHNRNVYFCFVAHNCVGGERFAYLHREGGETTRGGHVNGNIIQGFASNATRFIETTDSASGKNMVNGNKFHLATQPGPASEWLWYAEKGTLNELYEWGMNWDYADYADADGDRYAESWYIGPDAGKNFVWRKIDSASGGLGSTVLDDSDGASGSQYLLLDRFGTPVQDLDTWDGAP